MQEVDARDAIDEIALIWQVRRWRRAAETPRTCAGLGEPVARPGRRAQERMAGIGGDNFSACHERSYDLAPFRDRVSSRSTTGGVTPITGTIVTTGGGGSADGARPLG
jgi:hypothetical protein